MRTAGSAACAPGLMRAHPGTRRGGSSSSRTLTQSTSAWARTAPVAGRGTTPRRHRGRPGDGRAEPPDHPVATDHATRPAPPAGELNQRNHYPHPRTSLTRESVMGIIASDHSRPRRRTISPTWDPRQEITSLILTCLIGIAGALGGAGRRPSCSTSTPCTDSSTYLPGSPPSPVSRPAARRPPCHRTQQPVGPVRAPLTHTPTRAAAAHHAAYLRLVSRQCPLARGRRPRADAADAPDGVAHDIAGTLRRREIGVGDM